MGKNYYDILGVSRNIDQEALKKAYYKVCKKWHPDKNKDNQKFAEEKFKEIAEAYDVLSDQEKKRIYDRHGEEGLKSGISGNSSRRSGNGYKDKFNFGDYFGYDNFHSQFDDEEYDNPYFKYYNTKNRNAGPNVFFTHNAGRQQPSNRKSKPITKELYVDLRDLFHGIDKHIKITRNTYQGPKEEMIEISVKKGWKDVTKIMFSNKGDEIQGMIPSDIIFVIREKKHPKFIRNENDLVYDVSISLEEALCGTKIDVMTLDDRHLRINVRDIVHPQYVKVIEGHGMPITDSLPKRGNLNIKFQVLWPRQLDDVQKDAMRIAFSDKN